MNYEKPKVSVCIVAYNHGKYIRNCLQSLVDQKTEFKFEIIIGDDCSTDNTKTIIEEFKKQYPALIKPIYNNQNIGALNNYYNVHSAATGEYIAHIDGDDYTLPGKLQAQVDYLDANPDCNIVWHRMKVQYESNPALIDDLIDTSKLPSKGFKRVDLLFYLSVGMHSSKMYRASLRNFKKPDFLILDFYIDVEQVGTGYAKILDHGPLGVYRAGIGVSSSGISTNIRLCKILEYFSEKYPEHKNAISVSVAVKAAAALKNKRWGEFYCYFCLYLRLFRFSSIRNIWKNRDSFKMFRLPKNINY